MRNTAAQQTPDAAEAVSCIGYAEHRLGNDESAISTLRRALQMDPDHTEARIYLGNIFYDRGDYEAALYHPSIARLPKITGTSSGSGD